MAIDNETVKRIAFLSKLKIEDSKVEETKEEFNKILNWIEQLNEVDTAQVEPLVSVNEENLRCREDVVTDGHKKDDVLANAPASSFDYFVVPKVVE